MRRALALFLAAAPLACSGGDDPYAVSAAETTVERPPDRFHLPAGAERTTRVETVPAGPAALARELVLPGTVGFDLDRRAAVVARLDGLVAEVHAELGQRVEEGDLLAVLASSELAEARAETIQAAHRVGFAARAAEREQGLWEKRITSEESHLAAQHEVAEARLDLATALQRLATLGVSTEGLELDHHSTHGAGDGDPETPEVLTRFERRAPLSGVIVAKDAVLGEAVSGDATLFEIADMSTVWVDLRVRAGQLASLAVGTPVRVSSAELGREVDAALAYLAPRLDPQTQTAIARISLENGDGVWRPGLYVTVHARVDGREVPVAVPPAALHRTPGVAARAHVFVAVSDGAFEAREVELGMDTPEGVEVLSGLRAGERVAVTEGVLLQAVWLGQGGAEE